MAGTGAYQPGSQPSLPSQLGGQQQGFTLFTAPLKAEAVGRKVRTYRDNPQHALLSGCICAEPTADSPLPDADSPSTGISQVPCSHHGRLSNNAAACCGTVCSHQTCSCSARPEQCPDLSQVREFNQALSSDASFAALALSPQDMQGLDAFLQR